MAQEFLDKNKLLAEARRILRDEKSLIDSFNKANSSISGIISRPPKNKLATINPDNSEYPENVIPLFSKKP